MSRTATSPRVALFVTCLVDQIRPSVGVATVGLLRRLGCDVTFDERQTCCGQPAYTTGYHDQARAVVQRNIELIHEQNPDWVVTPSGSCAAMMHHYPEFLSGDSEFHERAREIATKTFELSAFIVRVLRVTETGSHFAGRVTCHDSCHALRDLGIRDEPRTLLRNVRGLEFVETDRSDACCGFGGMFSVRYPSISVAMVDEKIAALEDARVDAVVSTDVGCLMQIDSRLRARGSSVQTLHLAELLCRT